MATEPQQDHRELFHTQFRDERAREWDVRLTVPLVHRFCRRYGLGLDRMQPHVLDAGPLAELAYEGTRYQAKAQAAPESLDQWLEAFDGPSYLAMQEAAVEAVLFFTLRTSVPREEIPGRIAAIRKDAAAAVAALTQALDLGDGMMSGGSADSPASTQPAPPAD